MSAAAQLSHRIPGRVRLKIIDRKGNADYFASLEQSLQGCPGLLDVQCNPLTGSVLLQHDPKTPFESILARVEAMGLFRVVAVTAPSASVGETPGPSIGELAARGVDLLNAGLSEASHGRLDLPSFYFLGFLGLGIREFARGHVMPPAVTLLWRALEVLQKRAGGSKP